MDLTGYRLGVNEQCGLNLSTAAVDRLVNQALRRIASERDWPWLELVETGTWPDAETITLDAAAKAVRDVVIGTVEYRPISAAQAEGDSRSVVGFSVSGSTLRVVPQPAEDAEYTVWYVAVENTLTLVSDVSLLPDEYADAAIYLACSMAHDRPQGKAATRENFMERYREARKTMLGTAANKRGPQLARTRLDVP